MHSSVNYQAPFAATATPVGAAPEQNQNKAVKKQAAAYTKAAKNDDPVLMQNAKVRRCARGWTVPTLVPWWGTAQDMRTSVATPHRVCAEVLVKGLSGAYRDARRTCGNAGR